MSDLAVQVLHGGHVVGVRRQRLGEQPRQEALGPAAIGVGAVGPVHALRANHDELDRILRRQQADGLADLGWEEMFDVE